MKFALCYRETFRGGSEERFAIHAAGCSDLGKERREYDAHVIVSDFASLEAAKNAILDADLREMGYDEEHLKVYPCVRSSAKVKKPVVAGRCSAALRRKPR